MNQLQNITNKTPIEIMLGVDKNGETTARKLYEFLELAPNNYSRWCKVNILDNGFAEEGIDFHSSQRKSEGRGNFAEDYKLTARFAKKLSMTVKNERGEEARKYFVQCEDKLKEVAINVNQLPPELQMFKSIFDQQAKQYIEMQKINDKVDSIREIVSLDTTSWREETGTILRKISVTLGGGQAFSQVRTESYELLNKRMGVDLQTRLTNKRRRMADNGVCKSAREKLSFVDVIAEDKKLVEGYTAIVKEMAIKYGL